MMLKIVFALAYLALCHASLEPDECFENCTQYKPKSPLVYCEYL